MFLTVPKKLFPVSYSTLLYSSEEELLGPYCSGRTMALSACLSTYEDKRFFYHPGVDPIAILRAISLNVKNRKVVSEGSTIAMQLARIARGNRNRNLYEKIVAAVWALYLEFIHSKKTILNLYDSHTLFVVCAPTFASLLLQKLPYRLYSVASNQVRV